MWKSAETNKFKIIANLMMMVDRIGGNEPGKMTGKDVTAALEEFGLKPNQENIAKVVAFYLGETDDDLISGKCV